MKIVLDTNVLINGFKDEYSFESRIIDAVISGELQAYANRQTISENKLIASQLISSSEYKSRLNTLYEKICWVANRRQIKAVKDPQDNKILESAVEARADFLITSDNDLLSLEDFNGIKIVTPSEFWSKHRDEGEDLWKQWTNFIKNGGN